ncbi:hypothetical protein GALMADRAFT_141085 [Galerina marginata CBS 339.88]|uniref:Uncharacterized protein n=1 Tax=Galerina marginata (strain CBS 339.88) TaxID=685588 RepID=A0A067SUW6_GALM3|nr:hypothetical protein GALMADRAFT_141085 [Galerina marginata CBS 339.88]
MEWNLLIDPDPRELFNGYKGPEPIYPEYYMRLESRRPFRYGPTLAHASNVSAGGFVMCKSPPRPNRFKWIRVVDAGEAPPGQTVGGALVEILQEFPGFDLRSKEGVEHAIFHIMHSIDSVAITQELGEHLLGGAYKGEDGDEE